MGRSSGDASTWRYESAAGVHPSSLTIAPGATSTASVRVTDPRLAGDTSESVVLSSPGGQTTVPITVRTTIGTGAGGGSFKGVALRAATAATGQKPRQTFQLFRGPSPGETDIKATSSRFGTDPNEHLESGFLVSPGASSSVTRVTTRSCHRGAALEPKAAYGLVPGGDAVRALDVRAGGSAKPVSGNWSLQWTNPVTGNELTEPFSGSIQFNEVQASGKGLPSNSRSATLAQGQTTSISRLTPTTPG